MHWWIFTAVANAVILAAVAGLTRSQQWRSNPLDIKQRQRHALEIHDNVVQGLATAKLSFELDRREDGMQAVEQTLAASRKIITDLLGEEGGELELRPGDFRRERAAGAPG